MGLWDRPKGSLRFVFPVAKGLAAGHVALAFSPDRGRLAYAGGDEARLWDTGTGKELRPLVAARAPEAGASPACALAFAAPGELLLYRAEAGPARAGVIRIRNLLGPDPLKRLGEIADGGVRGAVVRRDGKLYIAQGLDAGAGAGAIRGLARAGRERLRREDGRAALVGAPGPPGMRPRGASGSIRPVRSWPCPPARPGRRP